MELNGKVVVITGGYSGIGFELSELLSRKGSRVVILGRNQHKLKIAMANVSGARAFHADLKQEKSIDEAVHRIKSEFEKIDILINNAGVMHESKIIDDSHSIEKAEDEIKTNLLGPIILTKKLLPLLAKSASSSIVNISSGIVYSPMHKFPFYCASKIGLHSFTKSLRYQLRKTNINVVEVFPQKVSTKLSEGKVKGKGLPPKIAAQKIISGIEKDKKEINLGQIRLLKIASIIFPKLTSAFMQRL